MFRLPNVAPGNYELQARTTGPRGRPVRAHRAERRSSRRRRAHHRHRARRTRDRIGRHRHGRGAGLPAAAASDRRACGVSGFSAWRRRSADRAVNDDWTFELNNLTEARLIRVGTPQGWTLKSVTANGVDITDTPAEFPPGQTVERRRRRFVEAGRRRSRASSPTRATAPCSTPRSSSFPKTSGCGRSSRRFVKTARPDQEGRYRIPALPAVGPLPRHRRAGTRGWTSRRSRLPGVDQERRGALRVERGGEQVGGCEVCGPIALTAIRQVRCSPINGYGRCHRGTEHGVSMQILL